MSETQMRSQMSAQMEAQAKQMAELIAFMASQGMAVPQTLMAPPPPPLDPGAAPVSINTSVFHFFISLSDMTFCSLLRQKVRTTTDGTRPGVNQAAVLRGGPVGRGVVLWTIVCH